MTITTAGLNWWRTTLPGRSSGQIVYFAIGTGNTTPSVNDTKLAAEAYRTTFQSSADGNTGEEHMYGFVDLAFGNVTIAEVGLFAGATATTSANTGILVARALYSHSKQNTETITLDFDIIFT